ncbi:phosphatidate cytidylyltransferase [archaeon]|nr:phosphatidate cytidylyltransferase [archaeon]
MDLETKRQLIHMSGGVFPFYVFYVGLFASVSTFLFLIIAALIISYGYKNGVRFPIISEIVDSTERASVIDKFPGKGTITFFIGSLFALLLFRSNINIACAAIIILALGDSFSTLAGKRYGRHKIVYSPEKSIEGTIGGFIPAFIGAAIFVSPQIAIVGAIVGMAAETLPAKIEDNIIIPLAAGLVMFLL